jgi:hypothetical protein
MITLQCPKHFKYEARSRPKVECKYCWELYLLRETLPKECWVETKAFPKDVFVVEEGK